MKDNQMIACKTLAEWKAVIPALEKIINGEEALWLRGETPAFAEAMQASALTVPLCFARMESKKKTPITSYGPPVEAWFPKRNGRNITGKANRNLTVIEPFCK